MLTKGPLPAATVRKGGSGPRPPVNVRKLGYSPKEAAIATGLSLATIARGLADGSIPSTKFKDRRIISAATIDALVSPEPVD